MLGTYLVVATLPTELGLEVKGVVLDAVGVQGLLDTTQAVRHHLAENLDRRRLLLLVAANSNTEHSLSKLSLRFRV